MADASAALLPPPESLFPEPLDRLAFEDRLTRALMDADTAVSRGPVMPDFDISVFRAELAQFDFASNRQLDEVSDWAISQLKHGITHQTNPRYFGLFNPKPTYPSEVADRIVSAFNPQLASAATSPAAVEIERHVIRAVGARAGLGSNATGSFTSGGSEANLTGLLLALMRARPAYAADGLRAFKEHPVIYVSRDCHLAWLKIAHMSGIGRSSARLIATDGTGRMDVDALRMAVARDFRDGLLPTMVIATAGTTGAGMIDPIDACADVARANDMWLHVDAAWAGGLLASDRMRAALAGIERADSITIDGHKWFATSMGCGMLLTEHGNILSAAFQTSADFMPSQAASVDPYMMSAQWSRRFVGLRLFLALAVAGWDGYAIHVERAVALASMLGDMLGAMGWRVVNASPAAVVCLAPPQGGASASDVVDRLRAEGQYWASLLRFEGQDVVRACVSNGVSGPDDVAGLANALDRLARA